MKQIIGIACVDANGFYASKDGGPLPWPHTEGDLDWFQYITKGNIIVVGSNTKKELDKLPPLKNREIWAVGREYELKSVEDVLEKYKQDETGRSLFIGGGAKLWTAFEPHYDLFYLTTLKKSWIDEGYIWLNFNVKPIIENDRYIVYLTTDFN